MSTPTNLVDPREEPQNLLGERRAERASGLDRRQFQHATGPYLTRMFGTGKYPVLAEWVHDARHRKAAEIFDLGLGYLIAGIRNQLP
ncbi:TetR/AcrR family transcriptional regulator C-terminal domain-containing protein [Kribbella sp. NPDC004875]|uniref:TetR/AcrR family transcriptional regulator C-terminal domain-containing protein n=1 Tax=Kribbella sp. NPDC004875 TaxID=3364107 RepID=UPI0036BDDE05